MGNKDDQKDRLQDEESNTRQRRGYFSPLYSLFESESEMVTPGGHHSGDTNGFENQDDDSSIDSLYKTEMDMAGAGGYEHDDSSSRGTSCYGSSFDSSFKFPVAMTASEGHQHGGSVGEETGVRDCSMDGLFGSETEMKTAKTPSAHQYQKPTHKMRDGQNHSCCTDSLFESDTSSGDTSRDHSIEAEIVFTYDLPYVPQTAGEIPELPKRSPELTELTRPLVEIDENDFSRALYASRKQFEQERKYWDMKMNPDARRREHVAYPGKREKKREMRKARREASSPGHEGRKQQKLKLRVRKEAERLKRSIEEKGQGKEV